MSYQDIRYELDGAILTLTLNRPDKLNAYTATMGQELEDAFRRADQDDAVRVIVVTGAGRGFCAGADISAGAASFDASQGNTLAFGGTAQSGTRAGGGGFVRAIFECRKPSIAAINGPAVGVGLTMTLPMDIRLASTTARFGFIFARRGLAPEAASAWFLPRLVGLSQALRWCLTGRLFDAKEALAGGLVSELAEPDALLAQAYELAREIAETTAPIAVALTRQMLWRFAGADDPWDLLRLDGALAMDLGATGDVKEGVQAFIEKRKPSFPGRVSTGMPSRYPWWEDG